MEMYIYPLSEMHWNGSQVLPRNKALNAEYAKKGIQLGPAVCLSAEGPGRHMSLLYQHFMYQGHAYLDVRYADFFNACAASAGMIAETWMIAAEFFAELKMDIPHDVWLHAYWDVAA